MNLHQPEKVPCGANGPVNAYSMFRVIGHVTRLGKIRLSYVRFSYTMLRWILKCCHNDYTFSQVELNFSISIKFNCRSMVRSLARTADYPCATNRVRRTKFIENLNVPFLSRKVSTLPVPRTREILIPSINASHLSGVC